MADRCAPARQRRHAGRTGWIAGEFQRNPGDGAFIAGSRGTTLLPEQQPFHWLIREVRPLEAFVLEMELDNALLTFEWHFDALSKRRTRMTQKIVLSGDNAAAYAEQVEAGFSPGLANGMRRIASEMAVAERRSTTAG